MRTSFPDIRTVFKCIWKIFKIFLSFLPFILDILLDIWAVVSFYREQAYVSMGVLIFLLLGSSLLLQAFSWLWYNYGLEEDRNYLTEHVYLEKYLKNRNLLWVLHVCQLGLFLRFAGVMEIALRNLTTHTPLTVGIAMDLGHDLKLLRLFEAFSENAPQLTLMIAIIAHRKDAKLVTGLKTLVSFAAIVFSVVMYHRTMRSCHSDKAQLTLASSVVYFLWNFLLIVPRVVAVALFASSLPLMIAVHFVCLWLTLLLWAWLQKTNFMGNTVGERLYRATIALIWYFSWFDASKGGSRGRSIIYHSIIAVDITLLLVLWWESNQGASIFGRPAWAVFILVGASYTAGILVKIVYYKLFHPKKPAPEIKLMMMMSKDEKACAYLEEEVVDEVDYRPPSPPSPPKPATVDCRDNRAPAFFGGEVLLNDAIDFHVPIEPPSPPPPAARSLTGAQERMQKLADYFYS